MIVFGASRLSARGSSSHPLDCKVLRVWAGLLSDAPSEDDMYS